MNELPSAIYDGRKDYGYDRTEGRKMLSADWCVPLHRCLRRIYDVRKARPDLDPLILEIWRDISTAINRSRILVQQLGVDTTSPLRRKPAPANSQPQPVQPELPAPGQPGENPAGTQSESKANPAETQAEPSAIPDGVVFSARPIRSNIARALNRLAAAISPTVPVAPPNETPKGPTA